MTAGHLDLTRVDRARRDPRELLSLMDDEGIERAALINYVAPDVMGFTETVTPKSHVFFAHEPSGAEVALPIYRANRIVLPHHLMTVRVMLDAKGLMDADAFDDFVASASAKQSAS